MTDPLSRRAGAAVVWRTVQHVGVKGIYLIRIPVLARLLLPDDFGLMAIALVALDVLLHLTDFGMVPALVQRAATDDEHYHAAWSVNILRSVVVTAAVFLAAPLIAGVFSEPRAIPIIRAMAFRPVLQALASIRVADLNRDLRFRGLAGLHLSAAAMNAGSSIALAPFFGVWALVAGALGGPAVYTVLSYLIVPYRPRLRLDRGAATSLIRFGRWIFAIGIISLAGRFVLQTAISRRLGTADLGLYYLAAKIAYLPSEISAELIGTVAFPLYARLQADRARAARAFRLVLTGTAALLLPVIGLLIVLAPSLVEDLLGPRWIGTAPIIQVLAVATAVGLFGNAIDPIFKGLGQPYKVVVLEVVQTVLLVSLVWELAGRFGLVGAAAAWLPATGVTQLVGLMLLVQIFRRPFEGLARPMLTIAAISILGTAIAFGVDHMFTGLLGFLAAGASGVLIIYASLWLTERQLDLGLYELAASISPRLASLIGTRNDNS
jgi:O-antigen/teichoic acid export membrane protein